VILIHQRYGQTDGQMEDMRSQVARPRFALQASASRGKKITSATLERH